MSNVYLSYDGDGCGKKVGRAIIANDEKGLHDISAKIDLGHQIVNHWVAERGGKVISGGGDEGSFKVPDHCVSDLEQLRKDHEYATGITISIGCGGSLSEAGRALLAAKFRGKDQVAYYDERVEKDIDNARKRVKKGKATQEEYKLAEAYLEKAENNMADQKLEAKPEEHVDCPYCEETDGIDPDHCQFCHDAEVQADQQACPFCAEDEFGNPDSQAEEPCPFCVESEEECPYCKDNAASGPKEPEIAALDSHVAEQNSKIQSPDSNNAQAAPGSPDEKDQYNQMGMNPPAIGKPEIGNNSSPVGIGQANPMDNTAGAPVEPPNADAQEVQANDSLIPEEGAHSKEALQAIAQQIESETIEGNPEDKQVANQIDDTDIVGTASQANVSRPEGFDENTPGDMGLDEQHAEENGPDLSSVLKEGLDDHASNIQREQVVQMVSQALEGFKNSKDILERAKEQAPQLYNASIAMLKAMIEMAKMLGLDSSGSEEGSIDPQGVPAVTDAGQENEFEEPFPKHPDHGGERKPGHAAGLGDAAKNPKSNAPVGQPIGKLPAKATTHVARTVLAPGAINTKGQQKIIDPKTGETRWIDRKQGMVQSSTGVPVKPPKRGDDGQPQA